MRSVMLQINEYDDDIMMMIHTDSPQACIYLFIHYATEAAHITLQTYKIKHKALKTAKTLHSRETKFRYQQSEQIHSIVPS